MLERTIDRRRYSRVTVAWPVAVLAKDRIFTGSTVDMGPWGARVRLDAPRLEEWELVRLRVNQPDEPAFDVMALVWRVEPGGVALFFFKEWERTASEGRTVEWGGRCLEAPA
jgi:PilZ domain-containing protein